MNIKLQRMGISEHEQRNPSGFQAELWGMLEIFRSLALFPLSAVRFVPKRLSRDMVMNPPPRK